MDKILEIHKRIVYADATGQLRSHNGEALEEIELFGKPAYLRKMSNATISAIGIEYMERQLQAGKLGISAGMMQAQIADTPDQNSSIEQDKAKADQILKSGDAIVAEAKSTVLSLAEFSSYAKELFITHLYLPIIGDVFNPDDFLATPDSLDEDLYMSFALEVLPKEGENAEAGNFPQVPNRQTRRANVAQSRKKSK